MAADIIHVDMDAFYASVELVRRPELKGLPVIVGGSGTRGVVAAASYEARVYGVHSAMPSVQARRLCPEAVFLPGDHAHYAAVSRRVMAIFGRYTPLVEPMSLDEAFLDVSGSHRLHGASVEIARSIREAVRVEERLGCSVGIGPSKLVAKLASEHAKPRVDADGTRPGLGVHLVADVGSFLDPLPVRAVPGIGPATESRLSRLGVATVADLRRLPVESLVRALGSATGRQLHELANGRDPRRVQVDAEPKSVSHEETFAADLFDEDRVAVEIVRMADAVGARLRRAGLVGRTVSLKVRFGDFRTITRSFTFDDATDDGTAIARTAKRLLSAVDLRSGVRLLGVGVSGLTRDRVAQLSFESVLARNDDWTQTNAAVDEIRERYGVDAIGPASTLGPSGPRTKRKGAQQWGPDREGGV